MAAAVAGALVVSAAPIALDQRRAILAAAVALEVHRGWRVETQTDYQATLVKGHRPNHILHLLLTIITLGLWVIVWVIVALAGGEKRQVVTIDEFGREVAPPPRPSLWR